MPTTGGAFTFLVENAQKMFGEVRSYLYVGHRPDTHPWWRTDFWEALGRPEISVIDIQAPNLLSATEFSKNLIHGDIRTHDVSGFDLVFWDEGPEHVTRVEALAFAAKSLTISTHILYSCPWGYQPQGGGPGDPEFHHWGPMPEDFASVGMLTETFGVMFDGKGNGHGNLIAWT